MKILCVCDQIDPIVYNSEIKERFGDVDYILSAGDLPMEYIDFIVSSLNKPAFFVFGNHNLKEYDLFHRTATQEIGQPTIPISTHSHGAAYAGFKIISSKKFIIAGASGSMLYNYGKSQFSDTQMFFKLLKLLPRLLINKIFYGRYLDVFLTHAPPLGIHDKPDPCHKGFKCYLWFLRWFKPKYMVHGHIHLYDLQEKRISQYHQTTIINAFEHYVIDTDKEKNI